MLRSKDGYQICASSLRFGSGLYDEAGFLGGFTYVGVRVGVLTLYPAGGPYICVWGFFCGSGAVYPLLSCSGWGRLLLSLFWCGCSTLFPGAPAVFRCVHAASYPSRVPHLADSGWLPYSCGGRLAWGSGCLGTDVLIPHLFSTLCRRNFPFRFFPFGVLHPWRVHQHVGPVCWSTPGVGLVGSLLRHLVFSHVSALPGGLRLAQPSQLLATLGFSGHRVSVLQLPWWRGLGLQPFPSFSGLLLLRLLAGVVGILHPVSGCSSCGGVCLVCSLQVRSPCCPSLTLGCVCFWPAVSQAFVGCVDGLGCPSWFVTALGSWTRALAVGWSWYLLFSGPFLGFFPLASRLAAGLRWLGFLLHCPPSVASLWRVLPWFFVRCLLACPHGAAVPLDSWVQWCSYSSCWVTYLRSGQCSSSVHDRDVAFPPLVGLAFGLSAVLLPQADAVGFGLCWSALLSGLLTGRYCSFALDSSFLSSVLVEGGAFHRFPSPLSSFGMWSPFGVIGVFCHYWSPTKVSMGGVFSLVW